MNADTIQTLNDRCVRLYKDACINWKVREAAIKYLQLALPHFVEGDHRIMAKRNGLRLKALVNLRWSRQPSWQVF